MATHYSNPKRESDPYALPDLETFETEYAECPSCGVTLTPDRGSFVCDECAAVEPDDVKTGWFYWYCFPGCLPDSDPVGPFDSEDEALENAREMADDDEGEA